MLMGDLRFAIRTLLRRPGFALVAVATLAVGIGANSAVFSVARGVLLRPLPFREPDRLVFVWEANPGRDRARNVVNPGNYLEWRDRNHVFEGLAAFAPWNVNLSGDAEPVRLDVGLVTTNFFSVLGVSPAIGRGFSAEDATPGGAGVVVLSDGLWKRRFGSDPSLVGREVVLDGEPATVVGIMPAVFSVPAGAQLWVPLREGGDEPLQRNARGRFLATVARLKPGVTAGAAHAEMRTIAAALEKERPEFNTGWTANVFPLHADLVRDLKPAVLVLGGAVALLLLIACGNLANLLLARSLAREREMAVRRALGAGVSRLVAQLLAESLVLAGLGGALGLVLASFIAQGLVSVVPPEVRTLFAVGLDPQVVAFTFALCVASALVSGLLPALHAARPGLSASLREGALGTGVSREKRRLARLVVTAEIALSVVLLVGAGLLLRSFANLSRVDAGFATDRVLTALVNLPRASYGEPERQARFFEDVVARVRASPGVVSAAAMSWRPMAVGSATSFSVADRPAPAPGQSPTADVRMVTSGLFRTLGIPLREGRDFDERDTLGRPDVVIVNERLAREFWPGQSPLGKRVRMEWWRKIEAEVVGVVGEVRIVALDQAPRFQLYWPHTQVPNGFMTVAVATAGRPEDAAGAIRSAVGALDPSLAVDRVATLESVVDESLRRPRFTFVLLGAFSATAAVLAALGLFGVLAYSVAQRRPEMGLRLAIGASPRDVARLVLGEGVRLSLLGAGAGIAGALALSGLLKSLLFEVSPYDPLALAAVAALVVACSLLAAWLPARRASRVDPAVTLRTE
jgi:putative ABC transport system permease protein